jgi:2-octaprenyl-6-methoxyphenol hydroxylase
MRIIIAGAGLVGLGLGLALKRSLGAAFDVVVADPVLANPSKAEHRAYAISAAGRRMFGALDVWNAMAVGAEPITEMVITDSRTRDVVRPAYLTFAGSGEPEERGGEPFAHMVWSSVINTVLMDACLAGGVTLRGEAVTGREVEEARTLVTFSGGDSLAAALLVAADGARSALRAMAGIGWVGWDYGQSGIVATIGHERSHGGRAIEHFLPSGPFAILPLPPLPDGGFRSSIVWTERSGDVEALLALGRDDLLDELETRFGLQLGAIRFLNAPRAYPLAFGMARSFIGERFALVGDAAHIIHPIAGQGLNLGLKDVAALAEAVVDAARLGLDVGAQHALSAYQAARRPDTLAMGAVTDGLNRMFSNDFAPLRLARDLGLGLVDRMPSLKGRFIRAAAGLDARQPRLLRGEAI